MPKRFEDLWLDSADDGASSPIGIDLARPWAEVEDLLTAWSRERGQCIEMGMMLEQARRLILQMLSAETLPKEITRRARDQVSVIETILRAADSGKS